MLIPLIFCGSGGETMETINELIDKCILDTPYPHINMNALEHDGKLVKQFNTVIMHIFESAKYVREEYMTKITQSSSNDNIKDIFSEIRRDLCKKFLTENNEISERSYIKLINILIYNCYMH